MLSNRLWFLLHGWCSLPVWALFCFVCVSGTVAVLSHEITWLANPNARASNPGQTATLPLAQQVANVREQFPTADISSVMTFEPYLVTAVAFSDHDKPYALAYVNPYSGAIQEINQGLTFIGFMRSLHGWLLFPWQQGYSVGYYLVSGLSLLLLGSVITGLFVYKKFWRSFIKPQVRFQQGRATMLADLHKVAGVWSIWFMLLMSLTGLWYLVQAVFWHAEIAIEPPSKLIPVAELPVGVHSVGVPSVSVQARAPLSLDAMLEQTQAQYPALTISYLMLPEHARDTLKIYAGSDHLFYDQSAYRLDINPWTGESVELLTPATMDGWQVAQHIADPLHYGTLGGLWTKIIWFFFGLLLSGMSVTGFMLYSQRLVKAARKEVRYA